MNLLPLPFTSHFSSVQAAPLTYDSPTTANTQVQPSSPGYALPRLSMADVYTQIS